MATSSEQSTAGEQSVTERQQLALEAFAEPSLPTSPPSRPSNARPTSSTVERQERQVVSPEDPSCAREQEFFIPVHGEVRLTPKEVAVVDHPAFQRLGDIFQLGQTYLVYRGATHMRLEHAMGALHVAHLMIEAINNNAGPPHPRPGDAIGMWNLGVKLRSDEIAMTRLGALLHDIGHLPAGHTLEDEMGALPPHDGDARLDLVLDRTEWHGSKHEPTLRALIDREYAEFAQQANLYAPNTSARLSASEILGLLISKDHKHYEMPENCEFRLGVCRDLIGNTICADLLDYLHRDWLHLGKQRGFDKRLLSYMEIRTRRERPTDSRLVINLRSGHKVRTDAVTAILDLLESRYQLSEIALFHRTKCCAAAMLERVIAELADHPESKGQFLDSLPERLIDMSDFEMLAFLEEQLSQLASSAQSPDWAARLKGARKLALRLRHRQLYKEFVACPEYKLADRAPEVQDRYSGPQTEDNALKRAQTGASNRLKALRLLEADFGMAPCSLAMYCPPRKMNTKIALVQVLVHGDVYTLDNFEGEHGDRGVTGGHLRAQKERFRRLWRVVFAIDPSERERLENAHLLEPLGRAINHCVLRLEPASGTIDESVRSLARELTTREGSPLFEKNLVEPSAAARGHAMQSYPGGAPSLLTCVGH
jgi:HD superfamily phosphohydrolase